MCHSVIIYNPSKSLNSLVKTLRLFDVEAKIEFWVHGNLLLICTSKYKVQAEDFADYLHADILFLEDVNNG